ncbi:MAG: ribonuclease E/G, partial [Limnohabitans sp.]
GHIRDTESSALQILRIIQEESMKDNTAAVHAQVPVEVASFLLNEKRPEIAKIELKQRLNVLLVPNRSLETPHYKIERLKHDDPRLDRIEASYKMAEEIEDPTTVTRRSQEPTNKQTPVIKGVLPDAPAPVAPPKPEPVAAQATPAPLAPPAPLPASGGFFGWLKRLLGGNAADTPSALATTPEKKEEKARDARGDRNRRGGRRGERADGQGEARESRNGRRGSGEARSERPESEARAPRPEKGERPPRERRQDTRTEAVTAFTGETAADNESRAERPSRGERTEGTRRERGEGRRERRERPPVPEQQLADTHMGATAEGATQSTAPAGESSTDTTSERRERRSRDRYGRDRRERTEARGESTEAALPSSTDGSEVAAGEFQRPQRSYFDRAQATPASAPSGSPASDNIALSPSTPAQAPAPAAAPLTAATAMPRVQAYTLPLTQLQQMAISCGLEWVSSDAGKVAAVQAAIAAEPQPVHVPRVRPPAVVIDEGPLVLVETRKDLSELKLPF